MEKEKSVDVLFVEDNIDDTELTEFAMLQANDRINFVHFTNGAEALNFIFAKKRFEGHRVHNELKLVLLDLSLPAMSGLEILRKIKEDESTRKLPVVILTSSTKHGDLDEAYRLGANGFVQKPKGFDGYVRNVGSLAFYWSTVNERPYH